MTVDEAIKILNEFEPHNFREFAAANGGRAVSYRHCRQSNYWPAWVAIAIAEKLERDAGRDMPATRRVMRSVRDYADYFHRRGIGAINFTICDCEQGDDECGHRPVVTRADLDSAIAEWEPRP